MPVLSPSGSSVRAVLLGIAILPFTTSCSPAKDVPMAQNESVVKNEAGGAHVPNGSGFISAGIRDFSSIEVAGPDDVTISVGPDFSIRAEGERAALSRLRFEKKGAVLHISREPGYSDGVAKIKLSLPSLAGLSLAGSGDVHVDRLTGAGAVLSLVGSGDVSVSAVALESLDVSLTGSGSFDLAGTARRAKISVNGSGDVDGEMLKVDSADVALLGSGGASLASDGDVKVSLVGSGDVEVKGRARCSRSGAGSGEMTCG